MENIDARGKSCPLPIVLVAKAMRNLPTGTTVTVQADDRAFGAHVEMREIRKMRSDFGAAPARRVALVILGGSGGHHAQAGIGLAHLFSIKQRRRVAS